MLPYKQNCQWLGRKKEIQARAALQGKIHDQLTLLMLPTEITEIIACNVMPQDLLNLRLTCSSLGRKIRNVFAKEWFTTVHINLDPRGLKKLHSISSCEHLREQVQKLVIEGPESIQSRSILASDFVGPWHSANELELLFRPSSGALMLQDILVTRLPNCRSFRHF